MAGQSVILDRLGTNPTQFTGLLSFAAATIACVIAARRSLSRDAGIWQVLAFMNGLFLIEIFIGYDIASTITWMRCGRKVSTASVAKCKKP